MNRHRITILIGLVAGATAALPAPALANPLLSGYGGPGQGNQAILGSGLVNGPRGGGGGGASGEGGAGAGSGSSGAGGESTAASTGGESESGSSAPPPGGRGGSSPGGSSPGGSSGSPGRASGAQRVGGANATRRHALRGTARAAVGADRFYPAAERVPAGAQAGTLGLSDEDALLIVLALASLVLVAGLMRRSTRTVAVGRRQ